MEGKGGMVLVGQKKIGGGGAWLVSVGGRYSSFPSLPFLIPAIDSFFAVLIDSFGAAPITY
jgi:hypothetical protein